MVEHHREYNRAAGSDRVLSPLYELVLEGLTKAHENFATKLAFFYIRGVFMAYWLLAHEAELQALNREADATFAQVSALLVPSATAGG